MRSRTGSPVAWAFVAAIVPVHLAVAQPAPPAAGSAPAADEPAWYERLSGAPIAIGGNVGYEFRVQAGDFQESVMNHLLYARVDASTYLWQPWFAQLNGGLGLTGSWTRLDDTGGAGVETRGYTLDQFVTGSLQLSLFPASRFPFEAHVDVTDSRSDAALAALPAARWTRAGFSQAWRPADAPYALSGGYDHASQDGVLGTDTQDSVYLTGDARWKDNTLSATVNYNRNERGSTDEEASYGNAYLRHTYLPSPAWSVESTANVARNTFDLLGGTNEATILQATSAAYWRPLALPYTATATLRVFDADVNGTSTTTAFGTLGGTYDYNANLRASVSVGGGAIAVDEGTQYLYTSLASVTWQGNTVALGPFTYDWSASGSLSWNGIGGSAIRTEDRFALERSVGIAATSFAHRLARSFALDNGSVVSATLSQNLGAARTTAKRSEFDDISALSTSASLMWTAGSGQVTGYANLTFTDSRDLVLRDNTFQMANLQVSGTWDISRNSQLVGNLTAQWVSTQSAPRDPLAPGSFGLPSAKQVSTGLGADILYRHDRVFGVPRLRFVSELRATDQAIVEQDQAYLLPATETLSWDNRLEYLIGRLRVTLGYRLAEVNGNRVQVAGLRVQRDFGSVVSW